MNVEYSESEMTPESRSAEPVLALDTGSPIVSAAIGAGSRLVAQRSVELRESSSRLMGLLDSLLRRADLSVSDLTAVIGLEGPGSFTGLRVGFATLQGLTQALPIDAGVVSTLRVLASLATDVSQPTIACVDALRGEWMVQEFLHDRPTHEPKLVASSDLVQLRSAEFIGFGISRLRDRAPEPDRPIFTEPGPLAGRAIELLDSGWIRWTVQGLTRPRYQRPPAARRSL